jgi:hypothetical protein
VNQTKKDGTHTQTLKLKEEDQVHKTHTTRGGATLFFFPFNYFTLGDEQAIIALQNETTVTTSYCCCCC